MTLYYANDSIFNSIWLPWVPLKYLQQSETSDDVRKFSDIIFHDIIRLV